jgi:hypothetical protein
LHAESFRSFSIETTMKLGDVLTAAELAELRARMSNAEFDERVAEL